MRPVRAVWGPSVLRRRLVGYASCALVVGGFALSAPAQSAAASTCAQGRTLLQCNEKIGLYNDSLTSLVGGYLGSELFAAHVPAHLSDPALAQFWSFQSAVGLTRGMYEFSLINQNANIDFEQVQPAAKLPPPVVKPDALVSRSLASAMSNLLRAEQTEVVNLVAMETALDRATAAALQRSRPDWVAYQQYVAAGFARRAAAVIPKVITRERLVSRALSATGMLFGVGPADQTVSQRWIRKHGFPGGIRQDTFTLGLTQFLLGVAKTEFLKATLGPTSYSLSQYIASSSVIATEHGAASSLQQFAARIPAVPRPA